jgi:hypothetical protein
VRAINKAPIRDAVKPVTIHITAKQAVIGSKKDPGECAAALAAKHDVPQCTEARIHISTSYLKVRDTWYRYRTPAALRTEIVGFDRGAPFTPGAYQLNPIQPSHRATGERQGGRTRLRPDRSAKHRRSRPAPHQVTGVRNRPDLDHL